MGIWGPGVFDGDSAYDLRDFFCDNLVTYIESCLYRMMRDAKGYYEKWGADSFFAALSIFHLLVIEINASPPQPNDVRHWRKEFLYWWEVVFSEAEVNEETEYIAKRRLAVDNTFDSLCELADHYHSKNSLPYIHTWKWQPVLLEYNRSNEGFILDQLNFLQLRVQSALYDFENDDDWWLNSNYDGEFVLAAVYTLRLLLEKCDYQPPEGIIVEGWKKKCLVWFGTEHDKSDKNSEYFIKRLEVIEDTFNDLIHLSKNWIPRHQRKPKSQ